MGKGRDMAEFTRYMRSSLLSLGVPEPVVDKFESDLLGRYHGERKYVPTKTESSRDKVRALRASGVKSRTAQKKVSGR